MVTKNDVTDVKTTPKDWVKLGLSPSTVIEEWDCRPTEFEELVDQRVRMAEDDWDEVVGKSNKDALLIKLEAAAAKYKDEIARCSDSAYEDHPHLQVLYNDYMELCDEYHEFSLKGDKT